MTHRESQGVEGILQFLDPKVEWRNPPDSPIAGIFHGHDGVREWQRLTDEVFDEMHFWPEELIEAPTAECWHCATPAFVDWEARWSSMCRSLM